MNCSLEREFTKHPRYLYHLLTLLHSRSASKERRATIVLEAGRSYELELRQWSDPRVIPSGPFVARGALRIGCRLVESPSKLRDEAVALARRVDVPIIVAGTNTDWESEGFDRKTLA